MNRILLVSLLLLTACQTKTKQANQVGDAEKPRHMLVSRASMKEIAGEPGARLITWETNYHSCDPFQNLNVKRSGNTVNIDILTTPPPGACTMESGSTQKVSLLLPPGTFYTGRYRISEAITVHLNGQEIGVVNPE